MTKLTQMLASTGFIVVNKELIKKVGLDAAVLLGELCEESDYYASKEQLDEDGFFYSTIENLEKNTLLKKSKQSEGIKALESLNAISKKVQGLPAKRFFRVNIDAINTLVKSNEHDTPSLPNLGNLDSLKDENNSTDVKQEIIIDNNSNNNISNNIKRKEYTKAINTDPFGNKPKGSEHTLHYPEPKDIENYCKLKGYDLEEKDRNILMSLERLIYDRYDGQDVEKIKLLYHWLLDCFFAGRGINKNQLSQELEKLDKLDRDTQLLNIKVCIFSLYHQLGNDYSQYLKDFPNFEKNFDEIYKPVKKTSNYTDERFIRESILEWVPPDEEEDFR